MHGHEVESMAALRTLIAEPPVIMSKRVQTRLDEHCLTIIEHSAVCALGLPGGDSDITYFDLRRTPVAYARHQEIGLAWPVGRPVPEVLLGKNEQSCSLLFMMPGIGFALRANGRCSWRRGLLQVRADALFLHCSRAMVRADFWRPRLPWQGADLSAGEGVLSDDAQAFIARSPYLLILTQDGAEGTELSPRGDPDGFVRVRDARTLLIPERPGNKVACSLSNILRDPGVTLSFVLPGQPLLLSVVGRASLTAEPQTLAALANAGKLPVVATALRVERFRFVECAALVEAGLWREETYVEAGAMASFSKMLAEHMNGKGLLGKATSLLVDTVVKRDLKRLY